MFNPVDKQNSVTQSIVLLFILHFNLESICTFLKAIDLGHSVVAVPGLFLSVQRPSME
jgi:hypothetical protein